MSRPPAPTIPLHGDEPIQLNAFLDYYRAELLDRAWGLDDEQLQLALPPSTLTMARLIGHLAFVEDIWFRFRFDGEQPSEPWASLDWDDDPDAEMALAQQWSGDELRAQFAASCAASRRTVDEATSLDQRSERSNADGEHWDLRWILIHMIEEYARHCGHADLIRQSIDGDRAR